MIYDRLPEDIKEKVDYYVTENVKIYTRTYLLSDLNNFHINKLQRLIFGYYYQLQWISPSYACIEIDIINWLNHPHSENMDTPFMTGLITDRFIDVLKRIFIKPKLVNDAITLAISCNGIDNDYSENLPYSCLNKLTSKKFIIHKILNTLTIPELESFYIYMMNRIGKLTNHNLLEISCNYI